MRLSSLWFAVSTLTAYVLADDVLSSNGWQVCGIGKTVTLDTLVARYERSTRSLLFNFTGSSTTMQNVTAALSIDIFGQQVYHVSFNPCDTGLTQFCPLLATNFSSQSLQSIPESNASQIPSIAYGLPDIDGLLTLQISQAGTNNSSACIRSPLTNGKTVRLPAVQYTAIALSGVAMLTTVVAIVLTAGTPGASAALAPAFGQMAGWLQTLAVTGMLSISYPAIYTNFAANFGFSVGLMAWPSMQRSIDSIRTATAGNLTADTYNTLATSPTSTLQSIYQATGRPFSGIQAFAKLVSIPQDNIFMTFLLFFAMLTAAVLVFFALFTTISIIHSRYQSPVMSKRPSTLKILSQLAKTMTILLLIFYGVWTLFAIYQFINGDSWLAKLLAALSFVLITLLLAGSAVRLALKTRHSKLQATLLDKSHAEADDYCNIFYGPFKQIYWWAFIPLMLCTCVRGLLIAGADGNGLAQSVALLVVETALLAVLIWTRPYQSLSSNIVDIAIQVLRIVTGVVLLIFASGSGITPTTKATIGLAIIAVQAVFTGLLAIFLILHSILICIRESPKCRFRRQAELAGREHDDLTELTAHNSLLIANPPPLNTRWKLPLRSPLFSPLRSPFSPTFGDKRGAYDRLPDVDASRAEHRSRAYAELGYHGAEKSNGTHLLNAIPTKDLRRHRYGERPSDLRVVTNMSPPLLVRRPE